MHNLHNMVKAGKAESVGQAVDKAVEMARPLDNRATLERQTAAQGPDRQSRGGPNRQHTGNMTFNLKLARSVCLARYCAAR